MASIYDYELYKRYLQSLNLSWEEYEKRLQAWCKENKF